MKKKFFWVLALVLICTSCLFACSPIKLDDGPSAKDTVFGNGGSAVVKGDYLYFTNAYKNYEDLGVNDNDYNDDDVKIYGIYRVKLNSSGSVDVNEDGTPQGAKLMVPIVGGYAKSGLYIGGDYLFYTTPYSAMSSGSNSKKLTGLLRFERVKLDGTDRTVLSEGEFTTKCDYNINHIGGTTYITVYGTKDESTSDNSSSSESKEKDIYVIKSQGGNYSSYQITTSATSYATYLQDDIYYNRNVDEVNKYIYYTKNNDSLYSIYRKPLADGKEEELLISSQELKIVAVQNDRVYYKEGNELCSSISFTSQDKRRYASLPVADEATSGITDYAILGTSSGTPVDLGIVTVMKNDTEYSVVIYGANGNSQTTGTAQTKTSFAKKHGTDSVLDKQINIIFTKGSQIFYTVEGAEDKALYAYDYSQPDSVDNHYVVIYNFSDSLDDTNITFDYDKDRVFFFGKVDNSNQKFDYLQMALLEGNTYKDSEEKSVANYIGKLDETDIKKEEEE